MSGAFPAFRPMTTAMAIWLVGALPAMAQEARLRVNIFAGPQNVGLLAAQEKGFFAKRGLSVEIQITPGSRAQRDGLVNGSYDIAQSAVDNPGALVGHGNAEGIIVAGRANGVVV